jgi:hypothetical protein
MIRGSVQLNIPTERSNPALQQKEHVILKERFDNELTEQAVKDLHDRTLNAIERIWNASFGVSAIKASSAFAEIPKNDSLPSQ